MGIHGNLRPPTDGTSDRNIHAAARVVFANSTARLAASYTTEDVWCLFADSDTGNIYMLTDDSPATFVAIGAGAGITAVVDDTTPELGGDLDLNGNQITGFTASRALETDGSGNLQVSAVTSTELNYLDGVTSAIQTQIDSKLDDVSDDATPQLGGNLDVNGSSIVSTSDGDIVFTPDGTGVVDINSNVDISGDIIVGLDGALRQGTSDGGDSGTTYIAGGGNESPSRGGMIALGGNEAVGGNAGDVAVYAGDVSGAGFEVYINLTKKFDVDHDGNASFVGNVDVDGRLIANTTAGFDAEYDNGTKTASFAIDWENGNKQKVTINNAGPLTITYTNAPPDVCHCQLKIVQGATPGTVTWPSMKWQGGSAIELGTSTGDEDLVTVYYDGSGYYASGGSFSTP